MENFFVPKIQILFVNNLNLFLIIKRKKILDFAKIFQAITDEKWKDEELQKLKKERDEAFADMYRGFSITQAERDKINAWKKEHDENQHGLKTDMERCRAGGAIGGRYSFDFTGTSIGTFGTCYCGSCRSKAIENCGGDIKIYRKLIKEYDAEFSFQEP